MSIPLDNLYEYLESLSNEALFCYLFRPHGSKNISDLSVLRDYVKDKTKVTSSFNESLATTLITGIRVVFHDQEPLLQDYLFNSNVQIDKLYSHIDHYHQTRVSYTSTYLKLNLIKTEIHARLTFVGGPTLHDSAILIHGDYNTNIDTLKSYGYIPVFLWSHALLALDWFRFASYDLSLGTLKEKTKKFLIYCRDWTGTREYRLKFQELLIKSNLLTNSETSINKLVDGVYIKDYTPLNLNYNVIDRTIFNQLKSNTFNSDSSATYVANDFNNTDISIILETVFDVDFVHLTEKTLRAIACGHPFIIVSGSGSLEFLKKYGFKTFSPYINEDYDSESDPMQRLTKIINTMIEIDNLPADKYRSMISEITEIAKFNKAHFFSKEFFNQVVGEYQNDLHDAIKQVKSQTIGKDYLTYIRERKIQQLPRDKELGKCRSRELRKLRQQNGLYRKIKPNSEQ